MDMVNVTINEKNVFVPEGATILEAAEQLKIHIPTLCYLDLGDLKMVNKVASCRICVVEVDGFERLVPSCATPVSPGMVIRTNTKRVLRARRKVLELLVSDHPLDCLNCYKSTDCELQQLANDFGITKPSYREPAKSHFPLDTSSSAIKRELDKCIKCRRCETMCNDVQTVGVLTGYDRGFEPWWPRPK